jgi:hypothetical protein
LLLDVLLRLSFEVDLFHYPADGLVLLDVGSQLVLSNERHVILQEIKLCNFLAFIVFGVLYGDDVSRLERVVFVGDNLLVTKSKKYFSFLLSSWIV